MEKFLTVLTLAVITITSLAVCGNALADSSNVVIWYYWENQSQQAALYKAIMAFNNSQADYKVAAKYVPYADFKKQLSIGASAGELPDIVILDSPDHAFYSAMGIFADITGKFDTSMYDEVPLSSASLDGRLYGVPFGSNCLSLYYNKDMLDAAGIAVPTTWEELQSAALALTTDKVSGLAFCCLQNEAGTFNFMPWVWSTGATSFEIGSENGIKALTFVKSLADSGVMSKECINWTQGDVMNQFISGNVAMMVNGTWQVPILRKEAPDLNWDVTLIPRDVEYASALGGENYAVIAGGNEEGALAYLDYATGKEVVIELMAGFGYLSARDDIAEAQFVDDPVTRKFVDQMQYAQPRGPHQDWPSISEAISLAFNQVITDSKEPADAAAEAQSTIDRIIH